MLIKILGTGCSKCKTLENVVRLSVSQLWLDAQIEKVTEMEDIMQYDIMATPALIIDEKVIFVGKVPTLEEINQILVDK